jgi:hypothetical protein
MAGSGSGSRAARDCRGGRSLTLQGLRRDFLAVDALPPPLPSASKSSFRLPWYAWLAWMLGAAILVWWMVWRANDGSLNAHEFGRAVGVSLGALLFPVLFAWILWRVGGRTTITRDIAFFAMLALVVGANLVANPVRRRLAQTRVVLAQRNIERLQREAVAQGKAPDAEPVRAEQRKIDEARKDIARNSDPKERAVLEADEAVNAGLREAKAAYDAAVRDLHAAGFFQLTRFEAKEAIGPEREQVRAFAAANKALQEKIALGTFEFSRELRARHLAEPAVQEAIARYRANTTAQLGPVGRIRETDAEFAAVMLEFLDFAETNFGAWTVSEDKSRVLFKDTTTLERYNGIMQRLKQVRLDQATAQQQLRGAKAPAR